MHVKSLRYIPIASATNTYNTWLWAETSLAINGWTMDFLTMMRLKPCGRGQLKSCDIIPLRVCKEMTSEFAWHVSFGSSSMRLWGSLVPRPPRPAFCRLQYEKQWEGLDRFITWCVLLLTSRTVASHNHPVAIGLTGQTEQKERTEFRERRVKGREQTRLWADWMWCQQWHA